MKKSILLLLTYCLMSYAAHATINSNTRVYFPLTKPQEVSPITTWFKSMEKKFYTLKQTYWDKDKSVASSAVTMPAQAPTLAQKEPQTLTSEQVAYTCAAILCTTAATCFKVGCQKSYNKSIGQNGYYHLNNKAKEYLQRVRSAHNPQ